MMTLRAQTLWEKLRQFHVWSTIGHDLVNGWKPNPTQANIEYDLLSAASYALDHRGFAHAAHRAMAEASGRPALDFAAFRARGQPCMRASPLTKRYGWAAHYDAWGRRALIDPTSQSFRALARDPGLPKTRAMRSKRV